LWAVQHTQVESTRLGQNELQLLRNPVATASACMTGVVANVSISMVSIDSFFVRMVLAPELDDGRTIRNDLRQSLATRRLKKNCKKRARSSTRCPSTMAREMTSMEGDESV
jgi:hypothetical protein